MNRQKPAMLGLADGRVFSGYSIGIDGQTIGEIVFNTAMTGYQEILTDPSYAQQIVTLTYPHIGNVGVNPDDAESDRLWAAGLVIRDLSLISSNWRSRQTLEAYLIANSVVAIAGVDTRSLTHYIRDQGAQAACIIAGDGALDPKAAVQAAQQFSGLQGKDLASVVSTTDIKRWEENALDFGDQTPIISPKYHVVVYDFGVKRQILRLLVHYGCRVTVVPAQTSPEKVLALAPDGIVLSNGPGDPAACLYAVEATKIYLENNIPLFGICLGFQLLVLACGGKTIKMKFGHHGANHPVQDIRNQRVFITSQNHGFTVEESDLPATLQITHRSLFDGTLQGVLHRHKPAIAFQGHPEASPGPQDIYNLFAEFIEMMNHHKCVRTTAESQYAQKNGH